MLFNGNLVLTVDVSGSDGKGIFDFLQSLSLFLKSWDVSPDGYLINLEVNPIEES